MLGLLGSVTREGYLPDLEMKKVYSQAMAVVYPSLYEGFGIPILEGMTCGTPVLTANRSSMPEVAGDAAMLFDPFSIEEITNAIETVSENSTLRSEMIRKGLKRASQFSWKKSSQMTYEVYRSVARWSVNNLTGEPSVVPFSDSLDGTVDKQTRGEAA